MSEKNTDAAETKLSRLAIDGGKPIRTKPVPWEWPGVHYIDKAEMKLVGSVVKARSPFRFYGPDVQHMCDKLEQKFSRHLGVQHALAVASGTSALFTALGAFGAGPGDEVLLPGYLWASCLNAVVMLGAIPRMVDIDDTFTICPDDLKNKISPRSKVLVLVHMSGAPGHLDVIMDIARENKLKVLEDCAQANGARFKDRFVGTFGDIGIFSLQINKNITSGEGGLVVTNDDYLYKRCFAVHDLGFARTEKGRLLDTCEDERFQIWGIGARMNELTGAFALAQLEKLDKITAAMRKSKWIIRKNLENIPGLKFRRIIDPEGDSGAFLITIYENRGVCERFTNALRAEGIRGKGCSAPIFTMEEWGLHWYFRNKSLVNRRSISPNGWPWTAPENAFAKKYSYERNALPGCDDLAGRAALLMIPAKMTGQDIKDFTAAFRKVARHVL